MNKTTLSSLVSSFIENNPEYIGKEQQVEQMFQVLYQNKPDIQSDPKFVSTLRSRLDGMGAIQEQKDTKKIWMYWLLPVCSFGCVFGVLFLLVGNNMVTDDSRVVVPVLFQPEVIEVQHDNQSTLGGSSEIQEKEETSIMQSKIVNKVQEQPKLTQKLVSVVPQKQEVVKPSAGKTSQQDVDAVGQQSNIVDEGGEVTEPSSRITDRASTTPIDTSMLVLLGESDVGEVGEMLPDTLFMDEGPSSIQESSFPSSFSIGSDDISIDGDKSTEVFEDYCDEQKGEIKFSTGQTWCEVGEKKCEKQSYKNGTCNFLKK